MNDYYEGLDGLTEEELRKRVADLRERLEVVADGKVVRPLSSDEVLVVQVDIDNMKVARHVMESLREHRDVPLIIQLGKGVIDVFICKRDQLKYMRGSRVVLDQNVAKGEEES